MPYVEEGKARPRRELTEEAIELAMHSRWEEAVAANRNIIESFPTDVDAYNRLGRALMELGRFSEAKEAYTRSQELAPNNSIAKKNLERLSMLRESETPASTGHKAVSPELFVREMGKSRVVKLYHLAPKETLAKMTAGDQVFLRVKGQHLVVENSRRDFLGWVEPRYETRLIRLIDGGNQYACAVVSLDSGDSVKVIITETYQHPSQSGKLSFPVEANTGLRPGGKDSLLRRAEEEVFEELEQVEEEPVEGEAEEREGLPEGFTVMENSAQIEEDLAEKEETEE